MSDYRRSEIVSGLFVCLAIVVFMFFAFKVGGFDLLGLFRGKALACKAYFTDVKTLAPGVDVKVGGQPVGKVMSVRMVARALTPEQVEQLRAFHEEKAAGGLTAGMLRQLVEVGFELNDPTLKLNPERARVSLNQGSILATHFLELDPGEWLETETPLGILEANFPQDLVIGSREGTGFEELVAIMKPVVREFDATLKTINGRLLNEDNAAAVGSILKNLDKTVASGRDLAERLDTLFDRARDPRLQETIDSVAGASAQLKVQLETLQADVHGFLASATGVLNDNRAELAEVTRRLRRTMWQAEMAMRKIRANPAVLLFGDEETDFEAAAPDESALRRGGRVRPYAQRDEGEMRGE
jgi:hypothetical protein